jgi:hypothetical protein
MSIRASKTTTKEAPPKVKPEIETDTLTSIDSQSQEDSYIYVHCYFQNSFKDMLIRIWKSTFLVDKTSSARSSLIHAENISIAPQWTHIPDGVTYNFLLIFAGLPKSCRTFDLVEDIPQPGGFFVENISRNETDVYHINL